MTTRTPSTIQTESPFRFATQTQAPSDTDGPATWADALCLHAEPGWWFAHDGTEERGRAVALCNVCPRRSQCLDWAIDHNEQFGIWGGLTERERRPLHRRRARR